MRVPAGKASWSDVEAAVKKGRPKTAIELLEPIIQEALERARSGGGPTLIEAVTYRLGDHTTADDASRYRKNEEVEQARHQEPLIRLRRYLTELGVWDETREEELLADCQKQVDEAVETYLNTPVQAAGAMFDFMFEELPPALAEQRENALHYEPRGGDH